MEISRESLDVAKKEYLLHKKAIHKKQLECNRIVCEKMNDVIRSLNKKDSSVNFEKIKEIPFKKLYKVNEKVKIIKTEQSKDLITFIVYMDENSEVLLHTHDCKETVCVLKGHLIEKTREGKVYKEGDELMYDKYEKHNPYSIKKSEYEVTFYRNKKT